MKRSNPTIRVLLVDDHLIVRFGLASMLRTQADFSVVAEAGTGSEAVAQYQARRPDVVLMDLRLPDMTGIECTMAIRRFDRAARVIILTTFDEDENIFRAIQAGAKAYLLKDVRHEEFLAVLRGVSADEYRLPPRITDVLTRGLSEAKMSRRELAILRLIAGGLANKEVGSELGISESTVKGHVNHILFKLRARDRTEAVTIALRRGLMTI